MAQYKVGIRDLKTHLSSYLEKVQKGHTIIITSHGKPIANLTPNREELADRIKALQEAGLISWNGKKMRDISPVAINRGEKLASDIVVEMRDESLF
ncbi:MAG: type II toxin-antitoxin system Phd/YefM family antitoxin [Chloroflexi bacterium]|nr:type II toxin-antitoxin system Phd/YefM family antitoxin [Chloroflexota bacterium]